MNTARLELRRPRQARRRRGFTLLEMMLVVVIIGLLAGVAVLAIGKQGQTARRTATIAKMRTLQSAITQYFLQVGSYPLTLDLLKPTYIPSVPKDAWGREYYYQPTPPDTTHAYTLSSDGENPADQTDDISVWSLEED